MSKPRTHWLSTLHNGARALRLRLIRVEAESHLAAAEILANCQPRGAASTSIHFLRLLALELFIKHALLAISHLETSGHAYAELFRLLPAASQTEILEKAGEGVGPTKLAFDHEAILAEFGTNFVSLRYPYEKYLHMSEAEFRVHSDKWAATPGGADERTADFRFHPEELRGMLFALSELAAGRR